MFFFKDKSKLTSDQKKRLDTYKKSLKKDPDDGTTLFRIAELYDLDEKPDEAEDHYLEAVKAFMRAGFEKKAVASARAALKVRPDSEKIRDILAQLGEDPDQEEDSGETGEGGGDDHGATDSFDIDMDSLEDLPEIGSGEEQSPAAEEAPAEEPAPEPEPEAEPEVAAAEAEPEPAPEPEPEVAEVEPEPEPEPEVAEVEPEPEPEPEVAEVEPEPKPEPEVAEVAEVEPEPEVIEVTAEPEVAELEAEPEMVEVDPAAPSLEDIPADALLEGGDLLEVPTVDDAPAPAKAKDRSDQEWAEIALGLIQDRLNLTDEEEAAALLEDSTAYRIKEGSVLISEGDRDDHLYLILQGELVVSATNPSGETTELGILNDGDLFGEVGFLKQVPRTATVTSLGPGLVLEIDGDHLRTYLNSKTELANHLEQVLMQRVERTIKIYTEG